MSDVQEVLRSPVEGDVRLKVGLARALYQAGPVIPQLFEMLPEVLPALPCTLAPVCKQQKKYRKYCHQNLT